MDIQVIATGSDGNAYLIQDGPSRLLIECGIAFTQIRKALKYDFKGIDGCLVSHEHGDHTKGLKKMAAETNIKIYASKGTLECFELLDSQIVVIKSKTPVTINKWLILPFETQHDAKEPLGFVIQAQGGERLLFITDSYYIKFKLPAVDYMLLECNYDDETLKESIESGDTAPFLASRVRKSHFSLNNVKTFLKANDLTRLKGITLIHISNKNGDPLRYKKEIQELTGVPVKIGGAE